MQGCGGAQEADLADLLGQPAIRNPLLVQLGPLLSAALAFLQVEDGLFRFIDLGLVDIDGHFENVAFLPGLHLA